MTQAETRIPHLPERIQGLAGISTNLWWSWNRDARNLFRGIDPLVWRQTRHNPIELLQRVDPGRLIACAADPAFVDAYDRVCAQLQTALSGAHTWFRRVHPDRAASPIAYFCAEFGLHNSVPIYSGGLGILAGDHCKAASDLGLPLVGVGLMYTRGYFDQRLRTDGWQEDSDDPLKPAVTPLVPVLDQTGDPQVVEVPAYGRTVHVGVWRLMVGSVPVFLLDTDLERNHPDDRGLTHRLYAGGPGLRLRQEWILGVGGVRMLRRLGITPAAWHANEGHAAFMLFERLRELVDEGVSFEEAVARVRATSIFTTHTPVPAGHDRFGDDQVEACVGALWDALHVGRERFFALGRHPTEAQDQFHMTAAAIRLSGRVNGVSARHGRETRAIWQSLWPDRTQDEVPIGHVTNGVHLATWMANPMLDLLDAHLGGGWGARLDQPDAWEQLETLDDAILWDLHVRLKEHLLDYIRDEARRRWRDQWGEPARLVGAGTLLAADALTIGFARRFATYKRADLLFRDPNRLRRLVVDARRPIQLIFAGKAHPADEPGKRMLQRVYQFASDPSFEGRITFLEDYEMHLAHRMVEGVDLWLNLPHPPLEACGTSGMKAALNGVPQLGTHDGWWAEGFSGENGWTIPLSSGEDADEQDASHVYRLLESEVVPLFFTRDGRGVPLGWTARMKHAMRQAAARFTSRVMVQRYANDYYIPAGAGSEAVADPLRTVSSG